MSIKKKGDVFTRFCDFLGRQNIVSKALDWVSGWIVSPVSLPGFNDWIFVPSQEEKDLSLGNIYMPGLKGGAFGEGATAPKTATTPHAGESGDLPHSTAACNRRKYRGMHGRPCFYVSGSDEMCPYGSEVGYFWRYETPDGIYYYVDCCGVSTAINIWCNWCKEVNWCLGKGGDLYTCTMAIKAADLKTIASNTPDPKVYVPIGPPVGP